MLTGYHYTSLANWTGIQADRMIAPYPIDKPEFRQAGISNVKGMWIWQRKQGGREHAGSLLWQLATKGDPCVVLLQVEFSESAVLNPLASPIALTHTGSIGKWVYHEAGWLTEAWICTKPIPLENIQLLRVFNMVEMLQ
jgi:hypothetical protein